MSGPTQIHNQDDKSFLFVNVESSLGSLEQLQQSRHDGQIAMITMTVVIPAKKRTLAESPYHAMSS